jgi:hypothetical protein
MRYTREQYKEMFIELLNDCYPTYKVGHTEYGYGDIYAKIDPIAFEIELTDWIDFEEEEGAMYE